MAERIQIRRDTAANWTSVDPILAQGELGVETDTLKFKVGDGSNGWSNLNYLIDTGNYVTTSGTPTLTITRLDTSVSNTIAVNANNFTIGAKSGNITINVAQSTYFSVNTTNSSTFFFEGAPDSSKATGFILEITSGGGNGVNTFTQTWPASVRWPSGLAPTLTAGAANVDVLVFITDDGGTNWRGAVSQTDSY